MPHIEGRQYSDQEVKANLDDLWNRAHETYSKGEGSIAEKEAFRVMCVLTSYLE